MTPTPSQSQAITAPGNLLVVAAAGAGKTGTLVERCTRLLLDPHQPVSIRQILVVTFTEAAAAEVRERIRQKLEKIAATNAADETLQGQLAQIDSAHISTLHSFCFELIRKHVLELGIDPAVSVLDPQQAKLLFSHMLDLLLSEHYQDAHPLSGELKKVIQSHFNGWDQPVRDFVQRVHQFTQTRSAPDRWFEQTIAQLSRDTCPEWHVWYRETVQEWCQWWLPYLKSLPPEHKNGHECARILEKACAKADLHVATQILARDSDECWTRKKGVHRPAFNKLFTEAEFLASLLPDKAGEHPLDQDWDWMRQPLLTLLRFARQFAERFREEKLERGVLDFHDLEQFALELLIDPATHEPTPLAREWQRKFKAIFVDEYQDINAAQDLILTALSSDLPPGNRFLVGDMKQSIYRFRQADPRIFRNYLDRRGWQTIHLSENFRSHEGILRFVNPLFSWLMQPALGGLTYNDEASLKFGGSTDRPEMRASVGEKPPVEFHLLLTNEQPDGERSYSEGDEELPEVDNAEEEARLVAVRLRELKETGFNIYHQKEKQRRAVEWKDMVVLLRAAKNKLETYAKAFAAAGVPLQTKRNAFFTTQEVLDLCGVLSILDNPLQDIPLVGVLRSPLVGLSAEELASIRAHSTEKSFWRALQQFHKQPGQSPTRVKIDLFLQRFQQWRDARRCSSLAQRLEAILADTGYGNWLLTQPRGRERHANVHQLLRVARTFDEARGQSLYLFLRHIEELQDAAGDLEPAGCVEENAVRLMTVHQSKGLEFPVVAIADLGKRFNFSDLASSVAIHEQFGLASVIKPPHTGQRYPSLPLWLVRRAEYFEAIGEEMRVLYVALTRAQNHLLLFGSSTAKAGERWAARASEAPYPAEVCKHQSWLDWLGCFATLKQPQWTAEKTGSTEWFSFHVHQQPPDLAREERKVIPVPAGIDVLPQISYPNESASRLPAKTSVTALRKKADPDLEATNAPWRFHGEKDGKERGIATHTFLQHFSFSTVTSVVALRLEADRLVKQGFLSEDQLAWIDFEAVYAFWTGDLGRELLANAKNLRRELAFTFKATREDLERAALLEHFPVPENEFVIIQGTADLVLLLRDAIWLVDFKSDRLERSALSAATERYRPQLRLYATALAAIYNRPVACKAIFFLAQREVAWC